MRAGLAGVVLAAAALHGYEHGVQAASFHPLWLAWSMLPYAVCIAVAAAPSLRAPAVAGALAALAFDAYVHYVVFVAPKGSTAALLMLFGPLWNLLLVVPLAMLAAWLVARYRRRRV